MIGLIDIAPAFIFLTDKGFIPGADNYNPQEFGNASLIIIGVPFSIRFQRDRGQVFVDAGNEAIGWYKLEYVLEFVDNSITQKQFDEPPDLTLMANLLQKHWDQVVKLFNNQQQVLQLQVFTKQQTVDFLKKVFDKT